MNDLFIVISIFWIIIIYLIHRYFKSKCYKEMRRIHNLSVPPQVIVPLPIVNGIEVQSIPNNSIIINGKQSE